MINTKGIKGHWVGMSAVMMTLWAGAGGCADHVQSAIVACPCDQGICCTSGVCAPDQSSCDQATAALSSQAAGTWSGYTENFAFPSGSDALNLAFQVQPGGSFTGQVILGSGTPPPPATDGSVGWPASGFNPGDLMTQSARLIEGFAYSATNVRWTARRLQFDINVNEAWGPWCRLHQPVDNGHGDFTCMPNLGSAIGGGQCFLISPQRDEIPIDCGVWSTCEAMICNCSAAGCVTSNEISASFDLALRSDDADGSVLGPVLGTHNVRLIRASN